MKIKRRDGTYQKTLTPAKLKSLDAATGAFSGYAATFGNVDLGGDMIVKGAFAKWLAANDPTTVRVLWQHSSYSPIGFTTLMKEDDAGLYVEGQLIMDVQQARETAALAKANAIGGLSIGYGILDCSMEKYGPDDDMICMLKELSLREYSFVTFPMNPEAEILSMKGLVLDNVRDCEAYLREACGLSRKDAKTFISAVRGAKADADVGSLGQYTDAEKKDLADALKRLQATL